MRYADDCNVYLRSKRAANNTFENLTRFIEGTLKLTVNRAKSAVGRPWTRKLLGFSFTMGKNAKRRIAPKALAKAKKRIRELTRRGRFDFQTVMDHLKRYLIGWLGYFRFCQTPSVLRELEEWTRRRLRCLIWKHWKRGTTRFAELVKRGSDRIEAAKLAGTSHGSWHTSNTPLLSLVFSKVWFTTSGLPRFHALS